MSLQTENPEPQELETSPWVYPGPTLAWKPEESSIQEVTSIALVGADRQLTWDEYLLRLGDRLNWLVQKAGGPQPALKMLMQEAHGKGGLNLVGLNPKGPLGHQLIEQPHLQDLLMIQTGLSARQFPQKVRPNRELVEIIQQVSLMDWIAHLLPSEWD